MALLRKRGGKEDLQLLSDLDELCSKQEDTSTTTVGGGAEAAASAASKAAPPTDKDEAKDAENEDEMETIILHKETKETRIGVTLSGERGPPTITAIAPPPALAHGTLRVGDVIVAINDWSANGHSETTARLKRLQGRLRIRLQKRGVYSK